MSAKILLSRCLAGECCRYDGGTNLVPALRALVERGLAVPVCPEQLGGLPTPRCPSEIRGSRVVMRDGTDVTDAFRRGAERALAIGLDAGCTCAVVKAKSPSCGAGVIYDGKIAISENENKQIPAGPRSITSGISSAGAKSAHRA